ncbi:MAG: hypothetical protein V4598_00245 [Bdellovibrionota bacterium]
MKYILILMCLTSFSALASERENYVSSCEMVQKQIAAKYRELSDISSRMMVLDHDGEGSYSIDFNESENCESVPSDYHILQRRRERVEQELERLKVDRQRECPRVYPE